MRRALAGLVIAIGSTAIHCALGSLAKNEASDCALSVAQSMVRYFSTPAAPVEPTSQRLAPAPMPLLIAAEVTGPKSLSVIQ